MKAPILLLALACVSAGVAPHTRKGASILMDLAARRVVSETVSGRCRPPALPASIPLPVSSPRTSANVRAVAHPHTNGPIILPPFIVGPGASTNFWDIQRAVPTNWAWVTIVSNVAVRVGTNTFALPFYGQPSGSLTVTSSFPAAFFRLKGHRQ